MIHTQAAQLLSFSAVKSPVTYDLKLQQYIPHFYSFLKKLSI